MALNRDPNRLSSPVIFLVRMAVFLALAGFVALILYRQILTAFQANPGLNALILGVLAIGIILAFAQVFRLVPEVRWVNALRLGDTSEVKPPNLLAPMEAMLAGGRNTGAISTMTLRAILDSIGSRLDESREIARYLTGLLVFLGLLGTFWGLLETVGSIGTVIKSMRGGSDATVMFDDLKNGLSAPIAGMSIAFTSSLFGLAGSLILGFLDLQAGQAQNRFYNELENHLAGIATDPLADAAERGAIPQELADALSKLTSGVASGPNAAALANLAEGIHGLVKHMRSEQQMVRDWVQAQADQQNAIKGLLERIASEKERR